MAFTRQKMIDTINADPRIEGGVEDERNTDAGFWCYTAKGFKFDPMVAAAEHTNHEDTIRKLWSVYQTIQTCSCTECTN